MNKTLDYLRPRMTSQGFQIMTTLLKGVPFRVWRKPTSSTLKYHHKDDGKCLSVIGHTYEMIVAAYTSQMRIFEWYDSGIPSKSSDAMTIGIMFHDAFKYGSDGKGVRAKWANGPDDGERYTDTNHACIAYVYLVDHRATLEDYFGAKLTEKIMMIVRLHEGRWSPIYGKDRNSRADQYILEARHREIFTVHSLDMASANNTLHVPKEFRR